MKILLVDDSKSMRNIQKKALEKLGPVEFLEAGDGIEALMTLAGAVGTVDLMIVDWNMPKSEEFSDYAPLTVAQKKKILGLNAARLYDIEVPVDARLEGAPVVEPVGVPGP